MLAGISLKPRCRRRPCPRLPALEKPAVWGWAAPAGFVAGAPPGRSDVGEGAVARGRRTWPPSSSSGQRPRRRVRIPVQTDHRFRPKPITDFGPNRSPSVGAERRGTTPPGVRPSCFTGALAGLRDRALLSVMLYSFARVSAVLGMRRQDYFGQGSRGWLRLHEKGGKRHDVPAHHRAAAALDAYVEAAGFQEPKAAFFQTMDPAGRRLTGRALERRLVLAMIKRRAAAAWLPPSTCCHTFRATGITAYLSNGGDAGARAADRGARVTEDHEALRSHSGHGDGR